MTESMHKRPRIGADEVDALSRTRRFHRWQRGEVNAIKTRARRRERRSFGQRLRSGRI